MKLLKAKRPLLLVDNSTGPVAHTRVVYGVKISRGDIYLMVMDPDHGYKDVSLQLIQPGMIRLSFFAANEVRP